MLGRTNAGGAKQPYVEETYDSDGYLTDAVLHGHTKIRMAMFHSDIRLAHISLPNNIKSIGSLAFYNCCELSITSIPSGVKTIGGEAFKNCTNLTSLTFRSTPTVIVSDAFENCTNLTTINVPWAEGEVEDAPWGATNATINYNYTGA